MRTSPALFISLSLVAAVACSQSGSGVSLGDMPGRLSEAYCKKIYECCSTADLMGRDNEGPTEKDCRSHQSLSFAGIRDQIKKSNGKHRAVYRADQMEACIAGLKAIPCAGLKMSPKPPELAACDRYIEPRVAVGGACGYDHDCIDSSCEGAKDPADGVCAVRSPVGGTCESASCAQGAYCGNKTCEANKAEGDSCNANFQCASGGCNGYDADAGTPGTCGPRGGTATTCFLTTGCSAAPGAPSGDLGAVTAFGLLAAIALALSRRRRA